MSIAQERPAIAVPAATGNAVLGAGLFTAGAASFATSHTLVRFGTADVPSIEIAFLRFLSAAVLMAPLALRRRAGVLRTRRLPLNMLNGTLNATGALTLIYAVNVLPVALVTALTFTVPLFTTVFAILLLGERASPVRILATLVGFAGALVVLRPDSNGVTWAILLPVAGAMQMAAGLLITKRLTRTEGSLTISLHTTLWSLVVMGAACPFVWVTPTWQALAVGVAIGLTGTAGLFLWARAMSHADASLLAPFDYARLPVAALLAYIAYGEVPGLWTWIGGAIIIAATAWLARRERRAERARQATTAAGGTP
ncbi:MAG: DMT family transporter [Alphaproteobacteria bacterium]